MKKSKTQAQLDQAADRLLRQKYGVGLDWYNAKFKEQDGCAICGDHGKTRRLNVDHDHHWVDVKIVSTKNDFQGWDSEATYRGVLHCAHGASKSEAIREMKAILKRESVRGLLCHRCNRGLIMLRDRQDLLEKSIHYLDKFQNVVKPEFEWCDGCDGTGLMEGWNHRDGNSCPKCKGEAKI